MAESLKVVMVGNPDLGYTVHGPFADDSAAMDWIDDQDIIEHSSCVMDLFDPGQGYYLSDADDTEDAED